MGLITFYLGCINRQYFSEGSLVTYQKIPCAFRIRKFNFWESILQRYSDMVYKNKETKQKPHKCPSVGQWLCKCCFVEISDCSLMPKNWEKCLNTDRENHSRYTLKKKIKPQNNTVPFKWKQKHKLFLCLQRKIFKDTQFQQTERGMYMQNALNFYLS